MRKKKNEIYSFNIILSITIIIGKLIKRFRTKIGSSVGFLENKGAPIILRSGINNNSLPQLIFHRNLFPQRIKRAFTRSKRFEARVEKDFNTRGPRLRSPEFDYFGGKPSFISRTPSNKSSGTRIPSPPPPFLLSRSWLRLIDYSRVCLVTRLEI